MKRLSLRTLAIAVCAAALLVGCATGYRLDNRVQSFSALPSVPANLTYRFERLPSQAGRATQDQLEALADPALFRAGLRRDDANPRFSVQVGARAQRVVSPWADPFWDPWGGWGWGGHGLARRHALGFGVGYGAPLPMPEHTWFHREVSVVMRELPSNRVVYETSAVSDGPWIDQRVVLQAMFDAALQGFPNPPQGPRQVHVQIGGQQQAAAPAPAAR
ncbi:MAG TPA: DUF4136 domain-containing protein [Ramlibacter sp.]|nr:DUF4136 domain-containing protein [Ramlibacter sp.]